MWGIIITLALTLICWGIFVRSFVRDRSRYRNCYLLVFALGSTVPFMVSVSGDHAVDVLIVIFYSLLIGVLVTPFFLIHNGIVMLKKEGWQIPHLLSLVLGIVILLGEVGEFVSILLYGVSSTQEYNGTAAYLLLVLFITTIEYISVSVLVFVIYMLLLQIVPWKKSFDYVIILGAGLINGEKVSKLLSDRIDKAIEVYKRSSVRPKLIPSGGKGSDEKISEAEAMKRYLLEKGIPESDIILEDRSTTTLENLQNSKQIIEGFGEGKTAALVSSNYHVYRALRYCRKIGFKCTGIGGHVAFYFWPSALIREYIAVHAEKKHAVILALGWLASMVFVGGLVRGCFNGFI